MKQKQQTYWWLVIPLALLKFSLPFWLQSPVYELQRDEYLYYLQGQHPALGYLENPPLLAYLGKISSWLGGTEHWIMFWPAFIGALTVIITCMITAELGGKAFAQLLAALSLMTGAFLRVHALFQPNFLDIFFWTLTVYFLLRFIRIQKNYNLYPLALSLALGFWSKYSIAFVAAALLISLLITSQRKVIFQKKVLPALLLSLILILPNIYWQYAHNWPLVHHMKELRETQLRFISPKDFLTDQLLMTLPVVFIWIAGLIWVFREKQYRFLGFTYILVIILLITGSGKSYYSLGIYPVLFAAGAVSWQQWTVKVTWFRPLLVVIIAGFTFIILPMALAIKEPSKLAAFYKRHDIKHTWEDLKEHPLPQDFADMLGWKELSEKTEHAFYMTLPDSARERTLVYCSNYGQAGALQYYAEHPHFREHVISANGSFLLWIPDPVSFHHILFVTDEMPEKTDTVFSRFENYTIIDSVTNPMSRQFGNKIIFYRNAGEGTEGLVNQLLKKKKKIFTH